MTTITIVRIDDTTEELTTDQDYESVVFWARDRVEYNDHIKEIVVDFEEGRMIFRSIC